MRAGNGGSSGYSVIISVYMTQKRSLETTCPSFPSTRVNDCLSSTPELEKIELLTQKRNKQKVKQTFRLKTIGHCQKQLSTIRIQLQEEYNFPVFSTRFLGLKHRYVCRRHAISPGFSGQYQDLDVPSLTVHGSACNPMPSVVLAIFEHTLLLLVELYEQGTCLHVMESAPKYFYS